MITQINENNSNRYKDLFEEAAQILRDRGEDPKASITTLEEYFYYLPQLSKLTGLGTDTDDRPHKLNQTYGRRFTILPVDEDYFWIDANSRRITIPDNFSMNGVGVQGDQVAEVIYFKINRYFDFMDLNNTYIIIQWELQSSEDSNKVKTGTSMEWVRDIESEPEFLIFGWALDSRITEFPGRLTFSIRFVGVNENKADTENYGKIEYSFSTLDAQVAINSAISETVTLQFLGNWIKTNQDLNGTLINRIKTLIPVDAEQAQPPIYLLKLGDWVRSQQPVNTQEDKIYQIDLKGNNYQPKKYYVKDSEGKFVVYEHEYNKDLTYYERITEYVVDETVTEENYKPEELYINNGDSFEPAPSSFNSAETYYRETYGYTQAQVTGGSYILKAQATSHDGGIISYVWYYIPNDSNEAQEVKVEDTYIPVVEGEITQSNQKYTIDPKQLYYKQTQENGKATYDIAKVTPDENGQVDLAGHMLYLRYSILNAEKAGRYFVVAKNSLSHTSAVIPNPDVKMEKLTEPDEYGPITVLGPLATTFKGEGNKLLNSENEFTITLEGKPVISNTTQYSLFQWQRNGSDIAGATSDTLKIVAIDKEKDKQGTYTLKAKAYRNNEYIESSSKEFQVTYEASPINSVSLYYTKGEAPKVLVENDKAKVQVGNKLDVEHTLEYGYQYSDYTSTTYQWYYSTGMLDENEEPIYEPIEGATGQEYTIKGYADKDETKSLLGREVYCEVKNHYNSSTQTNKSKIVEVYG